MPRTLVETLLEIPSHVRVRLASALESGLLAPPWTAMAIRATVGGGHDDTSCARFRSGVRRGVSPLRSRLPEESTACGGRTSPPDFVWTGPEVAGLHARDTRRVYEELLGTAERSIWVSTYAFFDGPQAFRTLAARMDVIPGLEVTLLLNIDRRRMDTTAAESLVRRFADEFWHKEWPGAVRPKVYTTHVRSR